MNLKDLSFYKNDLAFPNDYKMLNNNIYESFYKNELVLINVKNHNDNFDKCLYFLPEGISFRVGVI